MEGTCLESKTEQYTKDLSITSEIKKGVAPKKVHNKIKQILSNHEHKSIWAGRTGSSNKITSQSKIEEIHQQEWRLPAKYNFLRRCQEVLPQIK